MHPTDCPDWEYTDIPGYSAELLRTTGEILTALRSAVADAKNLAADTKPGHEHMFRRLTPTGCAYYAGHYRGEEFRCLKHYRVGIPSDPRVGCPPDQVSPQMRILRDLIVTSMAGLDAGHLVPNAQLDKKQKIMYCVCIACRVFEFLNRIHPYANGNGHASRLCLIAILGRYGYWLRGWNIDPRPPDPPYTDLILEYRNGNREPLEKFILTCMLS